MGNIRYYWLKMKEDFFDSRRIKKLRKIAGGDTYTIIYLKMQLLALKTDGVLQWSGLEDNFADELALDLDEEPEDVEITLNYLLSCGLAETQDKINYFFPYVVLNTGSESSSTQRVREHREKQKLLQCNTNVTQEIDKDIDKDIDKREIYKEKSNFKKPTVEEITAYCRERNNNINAQHFYDYYSANGWKVGRNTMKDWKAAVRTWEQKEKPSKKTLVNNSFNSVDAFKLAQEKSMQEIEDMI